MSSLSDLGQRVADLYKEIVTTTVRFESLSRETSTTITDIRTAVQRVDDRIQQMHLDHVRERADLGSQIKALEARLSALSEGALHAAARDAARQTMQTIIKDSGIAQALLHVRAEVEPGTADGRLAPGTHGH